MNNGEDRDIERRLASIVLKPAPPGLRGRVLEAARINRRRGAWTTTRLRACLATCAATLAVIVIADAALSRSERTRIQAFLKDSTPKAENGEQQWALLADVLGGVVSPKMIAREKWLLTDRSRMMKTQRDVFPEEIFGEGI